LERICVAEPWRKSLVDHRLENSEENYHLSQHRNLKGRLTFSGLLKQTSGKKVERTTRPPLSAFKKK
jgi:hypothetical protein